MDYGMIYVDANGWTFDSAEEALQSFLYELPDLTEEETETVFQFTDRRSDAATNLRAIAYGITYAGLDYRFSGDNYPVPVPETDLPDRDSLTD